MLMDNDSLPDKPKTININGQTIPLWKIFLYATIGFFAFDALVGIFLILAGSSIHNYHLIGQLTSTTSILGLFCLLTMNNILRCESSRIVAKCSAITAIIANIIWVTPWLLIVWDFIRGYSSADACWRIIGDGIVISIYLTMLANYSSYTGQTPAIRGMKITSLITGGILALYLLAVITFSSINIDATTLRLLAIFAIIYLFCIITTPILVRGYKKKHGTNEMLINEQPASTETAPAQPVVDEAALRQQIEAEMREKIEKEVREKLERKAKETSPQPEIPEEEPKQS